MNISCIYPGQLNVSYKIVSHKKKHYLVLTAEMFYDWEKKDIIIFTDSYARKAEISKFLLSAGENLMNQEDEGMPKLRGEWIVMGSCFADEGAKVSAVMAKIGNQQKQLAVFGYREWQMGLAMDSELTEPLEIQSPVPILFVNAFGGKGYKKNPVGKGIETNELPMVEDPSQIIMSKSNSPEPAAFSKVLFDWSPRLELAGTMDEHWNKFIRPDMPDDFNWDFFNTAPKDQQIKGFFKGNEDFEFVNMHPNKPMNKGKLPGFDVKMFYAKEGSKKLTEIDVNLDTVVFCPELDLSMLYWRSVIEVSDYKASKITDILAAYELQDEEPKTFDYYQRDFEWRSEAWVNEDPLYRVFVTGELIPSKHISVQRILFAKAMSDSKTMVEGIKSDTAQILEERYKNNPKLDKALSSIETKMSDKGGESFVKTGKTDAMLIGNLVKSKIQEVRQKTFEMTRTPEELKKQVEKDVKDNKMDNDTAQKMMEHIEQSTTKYPPEIQELYDKVNAVIPFYLEDITKVNADNLVKPKIDEVNDIIDDFKKKKEIVALQDALGQAEGQIVTARKNYAGDPKNLDLFLSSLYELRDQIKAKLDHLLYGTPLPPDPLPRKGGVNQELDKYSSAISDQDFQEAKKQFSEMEGGISPAIFEGVDELKSKYFEKLSKDVKESGSAAEFMKKNLSKETTKNEDDSFFASYRLIAHNMADGKHPHSKTFSEIKQELLAKYAKDKDLSNGDYACLDLSGLDLSGADLSNCYMEQVKLVGTNLSGCDLRNSIIVRSDLTDANLSATEMQGTNIGASTVIRTDFRSARFDEQTIFELAEISNANMEAAVFNNIVFRSCLLEKVNLSKSQHKQATYVMSVIRDCNLEGSILDQCVFVKSNLEGSQFTKSDLDRCIFSEVSLDRTSFAEANIIYVSLGQTSTSQAKQENTIFDRATMTNTSFVFANFQKASFVQTIFKGATLMQAVFEHCIFDDAQMERVSFEDSSLKHSSFQHTNMMFCNLRSANIKNVNFSNANMYGVDFVKSTLGDTNFSSANLKKTILEDWRP